MWSQSDREGEISCDIPYTWNLKRNGTNELPEQKETHRLREWTYGCLGDGWVEERTFGMDMYTLLYLKWITTTTSGTAHGTLLNVMWQPRWKGSLGKNGCMYMDGWVPSLFIWNYHNIVNQLYPNTKSLKKFKKNKMNHQLLPKEKYLFSRV